MITPIKINIFTVIKLIIRLFNKKREPIKRGGDFLLSIAINDYAGVYDDLRGCINDQCNIINLFKDYEYVTLADSAATIKNVINAIDDIAQRAVAGDRVVIHYSGHGTQVADLNMDEVDGHDEAVCLYDGNITDDVVGRLLSSFAAGVRVLVLLDSCFSGTATRSVNIKNRGVGISYRSIKTKMAVADNMTWTVMSGCGENQISADAYINGNFHGAFSYYLVNSAKKGQSVEEWYLKVMGSRVRSYQDPTLEGRGKKDIFY